MKYILSLLFSLILTLAAFGQQSVGSAAGVFSGTSLEGKDISLEQQRGKVVVMTFWSTRCEICHSEIPKLNKLTEKYAGKDVFFMGLTMENETKVNLYLQKKPFKFTIIPNSLGVLLQYADRDNSGNPNVGYPFYFVINQNGEITFKSSGWDKSGKIDSEISRLLASASEKKPAENTTAKGN